MNGGNDPGAVDPEEYKESDGIYEDVIYSEESDINLKAARILRDKFEKDTNHKIVMTREEDKYVKLWERRAMANSIGADLFISLHANAAGPESANGFETLYYPTSKGGKKLAGKIQKNVIEELKPTDRGIKSRKNLHVLRKTHMPAVLIEMGFITNTEEEKKLHDDEYIDKMMNCIVESVESYNS